jgi:hypothetical protein
LAESPLDRDRLRRLTERLDAAAQRAERLLSESVVAAATAGQPHPPSPQRDATRSEPDDPPGHPNGTDGDPQRPPPSGWQRPRLDDGSDRDRWLDSDELELLLTVLAGVRDRIPPELRRRVAEAVRELLMALRALIDWYLERTDRPAQTSADVEDIPIL